jgi:hypothetical protein
LGLSGIRPEDVRKMDSTDFIPEMVKVGERIAETQVRPEHFDGF